MGGLPVRVRWWSWKIWKEKVQRSAATNKSNVCVTFNNHMQRTSSRTHYKTSKMSHLEWNNNLIIQITQRAGEPEWFEPQVLEEDIGTIETLVESKGTCDAGSWWEDWEQVEDDWGLETLRESMGKYNILIFKQNDISDVSFVISQLRVNKHCE